MIIEMSRAITASMPRVQLTSTATTAMRKKVAAAMIDPLLASMSLENVREVARDGHAQILDEVIQDMTLAQLKKVSKKWNPNRKIPQDVIMRDLQIELRDLVSGRAAPVKAQAGRTRRAAQPRMMAAE
jgi:hypothetical protein